jgi:hypothetical protein
MWGPAWLEPILRVRVQVFLTIVGRGGSAGVLRGEFEGHRLVFFANGFLSFSCELVTL